MRRLAPAAIIMIVVAILSLWLMSAAAAPRAPFSEKDLERTCGTCHPMDPVREAKLTREDWGLELDKMQVMGAKIKSRRVLLDYLTAHYGPPKLTTPVRASQAR